MINIVLINISLILIIYYLNENIKKFKERYNLHTTKNMFFFNVFFMLNFIFFFIFFFRFLNLFRKRSAIDISKVFNKLNEYDLITLLLFLLLLFISIKFFVYLFKLSFLKIHYYLMNVMNFSFNEEYKSLIYFFVTWPNRLILFFIYNNIIFFQLYRIYIYYFLKYFFSFLMLILFLIDLGYNGFCLVFFTKMLPWYSLYQLIFNINNFLYCDIEYLFDIIITDILYPLNTNLEFRLYYEYSEYESFFLPKKPEGYSLETDEYLIIRNYITKRLLV